MFYKEQESVLQFSWILIVFKDFLIIHVLQ